MSRLTLITKRSCPYVEKVKIALSEKQADYDIEYVDMNARPDWFDRVSPLGKVPVLKVSQDTGHEAAIFESDVIVEFIEEFLPGAGLHPADPVAKAQARSWMQFGSGFLPEVYAVWMARSEADYAAARDKVSGKLAHIEQTLGQGPYFHGKDFGCVDIVFAPLFCRIASFESLTPVGLLDGFPKVAAWATALTSRESVRETTPADQAETLYNALNLKESYLAQVGP